ncbi:MAG TPA: hypothetical protein VMT55_01395, partial [Candidatus Sulfotelmatobacter sp.]|nr:hypothetical protein [Candidatus Sulfotelmatobacter sp.]
MITDTERLAQLPKNMQSQFRPVQVLESRSRRARFWVNENGETIEFKGLTPARADLNRLNVNTNQPQGLMSASKAENENAGLKAIGGIESGVTHLGGFFADLEGFAQLFRKAPAKGRYLPWVRL